MKKIHDTKQLTAYVEKHNLQDYMDSDILAMASLLFFEKEEHLIQTGTTSDYLYFLVDGTVMVYSCLLYTSDAADEEDSVGLGGRRILKKKKTV